MHALATEARAPRLLRGAAPAARGRDGSRPLPGRRVPPGSHELDAVSAGRSSLHGAAGRLEGDVDERGEDDELHRPIIEGFRRREHLPESGVDELGQPVGPSEAEIKYGGLTGTCPQRTVVDQVTSLTAAGLAAGWRSAYGAVVRMRVEPGARTWDGVHIDESFPAVSSTCPATLSTPGPCTTPGPGFTVGAQSGGSNVIPVQPAMRNRFYDFHTSRSQTVSFLHDATRNPAGLNSCQNVCTQAYSCGGREIGRHTVTRSYRKGVHNGQNVTIIDVTKT